MYEGHQQLEFYDIFFGFCVFSRASDVDLLVFKPPPPKKKGLKREMGAGIPTYKSDPDEDSKSRPCRSIL